MSSDTLFIYTEPEKARLFDQFASAMKIVQERQRPYETVKQAMQAIIADDSVITITPKVIAEADGGKILRVVGNFDNAAEALDAGKYDYRYGWADNAREIGKVPMTIQPVDRKVKMVPLGQTRTTGELFGLYPKMADPMTLLTLGASFPQEQLEAPIFVVWKDHTGRFWYAILGRSGAGRDVNVFQVDPVGMWSDDCRVLLCE